MTDPCIYLSRALERAQSTKTSQAEVKGYIFFFPCVSCTVPKATQPDFPVHAQMCGEGGGVSLGTTQITFKTATERQSLCTVTAEGVQSQLNPPFPSRLPPHRRSWGC